MGSVVAMTTELRQLDAVATEHGWSIAYKTGERFERLTVSAHGREQVMQEYPISTTYTREGFQEVTVSWNEDQRAAKTVVGTHAGVAVQGLGQAFEKARDVLGQLA